MLNGKHFLFCFSCSMGVRFLLFATHLERQGDFLHLFNTSPARITKMKKIALRSHVVEASARKVQLQKSAANLRPALVSTIGTRFSTSKQKLTNRFNNVCNPSEISMITTSGRLANFIQFHTISQKKFTKPKEL